MHVNRCICICIMNTNPVPTLLINQKYGCISDVGNACVKTMVFVMMQQGNVNARQALQVSNIIFFSTYHESSDL